MTSRRPSIALVRCCRRIRRRSRPRLLPPGLPGRRDFHSLDIEPGGTDVVAARAMLSEARRDGVPASQLVLRWAYDKSDPLQVARADLVSKALERAGFTARPLAVNQDRLYPLNESGKSPINIRVGSWCPNWMSGSNWLPAVLRTGGHGNYAYISEPAVDEVIDAVSALPIDQQPAAWGALDEQIMTKYYPVVVFGGKSIRMLHGAQIAGMHIDPANGSTPTYKDIHIIQ